MWFRIDPSLALPIYLQIVRQVEGAVARGVLVAGDRLPPVRELAVEAAVNPNTVARAYRVLEERGLVETRRGAGTFICRETPRDAAGQQLGPELDRLLEQAHRRGIDDSDLLRLVEQRILGRGARREDERDDGPSRD